MKPLDWMWRHRRPLAPLYLAALVWLTGVALYKQYGHFSAHPVATGSILAWVVVAFGIQLLAVGAFVGKRTTRVVGNLVGAAYFTWLMYAHAQGPSSVAYQWFVIAAATAGLWWTNRNVEARVRMDRTAEAWPVIANALHIVGSTMPKAMFKVTANGGWEAHVVGPESRSVIDKVDQIAARMRLKRGRLTGYVTTSAHVTKLIYEGDAVTPKTTRLGDPDYTSVMDPIHIGHLPNGTPTHVRIFKEGFGALHMLVAGTNGSGKSNFVNLLIAHVVKAVDAVAWFIDLKGGAESGPWTRALGYQAVEKHQAVAMVAELKRIVDRRGGILRVLRFGKVWKPSRRHPVICVFIDEAAELTGDIDLDRALRELKSIARKARALGVYLLLATQLPTNEALGSTQIKAQFQWRICFRMNKRSQAQHILNNYDDVDVSALPGVDDPGHCYVEEMENQPYKTGTLYVPDELIDQMAVRYGPDQPDVDEETRAGMSDAYGDRDRDPLGELDEDEYRAAFARTGDDGTVGGDAGGDGGDPTGDAGGDDDYWATLVVPAQAARAGTTGDEESSMDPRLQGRPASIRDDMDPNEFYNEDFPPIPDVSLADLPSGDPEPETVKLDDVAAEEAFFAAADMAVKAGKTISPADLQGASTWSRATVHRRIEDYLNAGWLERVGHGEYVSTGGYKAGADVT
jgi:S-DNA-T family DNA segregation ATPase FtsK/SpoIIIE